jgi:glutathione peroxidase-family protein
LTPEKKIANINSFFDLEALDIDKNVVKFDQFKGKVTVITNVASYCGEIPSILVLRKMYFIHIVTGTTTFLTRALLSPPKLQ